MENRRYADSEDTKASAILLPSAAPPGLNRLL